MLIEFLLASLVTLLALAIFCGWTFAQERILINPGPLPLTFIEYPSAEITTGVRVNNFGEVVGSAKVNGSWVGYKRNAEGLFETIQFPGALQTGAAGIDDLGRIVGAALINDCPPGEEDFRCIVPRSFIFDSGVYTRVNMPSDWIPDGDRGNEAVAVNPARQMAGFFNPNDVWLSGYTLKTSEGTWAEIPFVQVRDLNGFVHTVGVYRAGESDEPFGVRFNPALPGYERIAFPGALSTIPTGLNNIGDIVGSYTDAAEVNHLFHFNGTDYVELRLPCTDGVISGINDSRILVGTCDGKGFLANLTAPTTQKIRPKIKTKHKRTSGNLELQTRRLGVQ